MRTAPIPHLRRHHGSVPGAAHDQGRSGIRGRLRPLALGGRGGLRQLLPAAPAADVQERLADLGLLEADRITRRWDAPTVVAVEDFQRARGLTVDGLAGPATVDLLLAG